jgi:hypothetical protein
MTSNEHPVCEDLAKVSTVKDAFEQLINCWGSQKTTSKQGNPSRN